MVASYVKGNLLLFKFYLDNIWKLHQLPQVIISFFLFTNQTSVSGCGTRTLSKKWLKRELQLEMEVSPSSCLARLPGAIFTIALSTGIGKFQSRSYNGEFDRLKAELRKLHAAERELISYRTTLVLLFRLVAVLTCFL